MAVALLAREVGDGVVVALDKDGLLCCNALYASSRCVSRGK